MRSRHSSSKKRPSRRLAAERKTQNRRRFVLEALEQRRLLAGDTASQLAEFYNTYGGQSAFTPEYRAVIEAMLYAQDDINNGNYASADARLAAVWDQYPIGDSSWNGVQDYDIPDPRKTVAGTAAAGSTTTAIKATIGNADYQGYQLRFTSGALAGWVFTVDNSTESGGVVTLNLGGTDAFPTAPALGDSFTLTKNLKSGEGVPGIAATGSTSNAIKSGIDFANYDGFLLRFTSGALAGQAFVVDNSTESGGVVTLNLGGADAFSAAPAAGDRFDLLFDAVNSDRPTAYAAYRMLQQIVDDADRITSTTPEQGTMTVLLPGCSQGPVASTLAELEAHTGTTVTRNLDPRVTANDYALLKDSVSLYQDYFLAVTDGRLALNLEFVELPGVCMQFAAPQPTSPTDARYEIRPDGNARTAVWDALAPEYRDSDAYWLVGPSMIPEAHNDPGSEFQSVSFLNGGIQTSWKTPAPLLISDDSWFLEKQIGAGSGDYTDVERRVYFPHWFQHEFFHYFFNQYQEFELEANSHQWQDTKKYGPWPSDFEGTFESDYYTESLNKRIKKAEVHPAERFKKSPETPPNATLFASLTIEDMVGRYSSGTVDGEIKKVGETYRWESDGGGNFIVTDEVASGRLGTEVPGEDFHIVLQQDWSGQYTSEIIGFQFRGTIYQRIDELLPLHDFTVSTFTTVEGNTTNTTNVVTVTRSGNTTVASSIDVELHGHTALPGVDFVCDTITVNFAANETEKSVPIKLLGDTTFENNEKLGLTIVSGAGGGQVGTKTPQAVLTIENDDVATVTVDISDAAPVIESGTLVFDVKLSGPRTAATMVTYSTSDGTATTAGGDYVGKSAQAVTIPAGATTAQISVVTNGDLLFEPNENLFVDISIAATGDLVLGDAQAVGTILNDTPALGVDFGSDLISPTNWKSSSLISTESLTVTDVSWDDGRPTAATFKVLTPAAGTNSGGIGASQIPMHSPSLQELGGYGRWAGPADFEWSGLTPNQTYRFFLFSSGEIHQSVSVLNQSPPVAFVQQSTNPGSLTVNDGVGTNVRSLDSYGILVTSDGSGEIRFNVSKAGTLDTRINAVALQEVPAPPSTNQYNFASSTFSTEEGDKTNTTSVVMLSRSDFHRAETVDVFLAGGTASSADDFIGGKVTVSFAVGEVSKPVPIQILGDNIEEADETITLSLANFSANGQAGTTQPTATLNIENDDIAPVISVSDVSLVEGDSGVTAFEFTVTLNEPAGHDVTFKYATVADSAAAGSDFTAISGLGTICVCQTSTTITVAVTGDTDLESDEQFFMDVTLDGSRGEAKFGPSSLDAITLEQIALHDTPGFAWDVEIVGNRAYVADRTGGLRVLNITNPASVSEIGFFDPVAQAQGVAVVGNIAYVAEGSDGLRLLDVSDPASITQVGVVNTPGVAWDVEVVGSTAFVADGNGGLRLYDVSNPAMITPLGFISTSGLARDVKVVGNTAYVAADTGGLRVLDVSNLATITQLGFFDTPSLSWNLEVVGNTVYVADAFSGLHVLDVSNPGMITQLGVYDTPDQAIGLAVVDGIAYVGDNARGLRVLDVRNPAMITELGFLDTPVADFDVEVVGGVAYVAGGGSGLQVMDIDFTTRVTGTIENDDLTPLDYGDAPAPFPTTAADNGASHEAVGPRLGALRDIEPNGIPSAAAEGDDTAGVDDEDGVMFGNIILGETMAGVNIELQNATSARIDAWLDFGGDGVWDAADQILSNAPVIGGLQTLNFTIPPTAVAGQTVARVRVSSTGNLGPTGPATDGEVEDYIVTIFSSRPEVVEVEANGGEAQRSMLNEIVVRFGSDVSAPASAFSIVDRSTSTVLDSLAVNSALVDGRTVSTLTFAPGNLVDSRANGTHSLRDGGYELRIDSTQIIPNGGGPSMADDYVFGDKAADAFFRLFGDSDGDRDVDGQDYGRFGLTFLKPSGDSAFDSRFDSDGDGDVDGQDYGRFGLRFLKTIPF